MRSSTLLAATAAVIGFTAANPLERRYTQCTVPGQQWHTCGDGWSGCCKTSPCKGPGVASSCPDGQGSTTPRPSPTVDDEEPAPSCPSVAPSGSPKPDDRWKKHCKEDNSDCNWSPNHHFILTDDENYSSNSTRQFWIHKEKGNGPRRDAISVFTGIPASVKSCELYWYNPIVGTMYGTFRDGSVNMTVLDLGDKKFKDAIKSDKATTNNVRPLLAKGGKEGGSLDLGNWYYSEMPATGLSNKKKLDCSKGELVIHLAMTGDDEKAHISDQFDKLDPGGQLATRAGWYLKYL